MLIFEEIKEKKTKENKRKHLFNPQIAKHFYLGPKTKVYTEYIIFAPILF